MKNVLVEGTKSKFQVLAQKPANVLKRIKGVLSDFGTNRNGRIYPRELWENVINSDYVREMINSHGLVGELDHPEERLEISLQEVSHVINDMWIEGDKVMGIIDILPTPNGKIINELLDYGTDIGISSRGAGSVGPDNVVDPDYQFITFDFVARPSCEAARLNTILEGVKIDLENNSADKVNSILESYKSELREESTKSNEDRYVEYVYNWMNERNAWGSLENLNGEVDFLKYIFDPKLKTNFGMVRAMYNDLYDQNGINGELFVSYDEWLDNEANLTESTNTNKEKFINFCKGKIQDLGTVPVEYYSRKGNIKVAFTQEIRDYGMCKVLDPTDCLEILDIEDALSFISEDGELQATPMITTDLLLARLEFNVIDKSFYKDILKYWEDLDMDYSMENSLGEGIKVSKITYKLDPAYKLTEAMSDQEVYKVVLNWYKDQIEAGKMTLNQCYELLSDKAKVSLNKLVDQSKIRESIMTKEVNKILKEAKLPKDVDQYKFDHPYDMLGDPDIMQDKLERAEKEVAELEDILKRDIPGFSRDEVEAHLRWAKENVEKIKSNIAYLNDLKKYRGKRNGIEEADEFKPNGIVDDLKKPKYDVDLEVESPLELNTGLLPIIDTGTYGREDYIFRWDDEDTPEDAEADWEELDRNIVDYGSPIIEEVIRKVLPSAKVTGTGVYHPREYNFTNDELEFKVDFNVNEYNNLEDKAFNDPEFGKFLKDNYSDRSGFISYLADNKDEFYQQDGWKRFVQVVMFNLNRIYNDEDYEQLTDEFWEDITSNGIYIK